MKTVDQLLDAVKAEHKIGSDYKLAQFLGMTDGAIRNYRHKRSMPDEVACVKIANALGMDGDVLAAQMQSQRARDDETKTFWKRVAHRLEFGAAHLVMFICVAIVSIAGYAPNAGATVLTDAQVHNAQDIHRIKYAFATIRRKLARLKGWFFDPFWVPCLA